MVQDAAVARAFEVPIGVIGQINDGIFIGGRMVIDLQRVVVGQRVDDVDLKRPRVAFLAVGTGQVQPQPGTPARLDRRHLPDLLVEADFAAVQAVDAVVDRQRVLLAVEREFALGDPIGVAPDECAEIGAGIFDIALDVVIAEQHIAHLSLAVGDHNGIDDAAVAADLDDHPVRVGERVEPDRLAADFAPGLAGDGVRGGMRGPRHTGECGQAAQ